MSAWLGDEMSMRTALAIASSVVMAVALAAAAKHLIVPTVVCAVVALALGFFVIRQPDRPQP
jgi:FtsH-binding integral membrane protein